jgi:hypothetical protein
MLLPMKLEALYDHRSCLEMHQTNVRAQSPREALLYIPRIVEHPEATVPKTAKLVLESTPDLRRVLIAGFG